MRLKHAVPSALKQFELIAGAGSESSKEACAMTLLAWCAGREWTDSPPCAHPLLRGEVIDVNDAEDTTSEMRAEIVRAGRDGILDTWWVPTRIVVWAFSYGKGEQRSDSRFERLIRALGRIAEWKVRKDRGLPSDFDLTGANLTGAYLTGANLTRAYLTGADLTDADLTGADLTRANLTGAYLTGANLTGANLTDADLTGAYLTGANLTGADLTDADLTDADLTRANLTRANLTGAYLTDADLTDADLTRANLTRAYGTPLGGMPDGWRLSESGLWVRAEPQNPTGNEGS